ncbi:MAG: LysM peptidoglycan-binding domain-containing protein, partial [Spartobacteria bacterium]|nr:LysM peptidoglycan-binding domain-containing protein [Spartobacteria bacterium]
SKCQQEIEGLRHQVEDLMNVNTRLEMMQRSLQDSVEQLLLGNFEYYEVREGDTLSSIAESPLVYGDAGKAEWIRQANSRRVDDLDDLRQGEMLIIPRFPPSGKYEF